MTILEITVAMGLLAIISAGIINFIIQQRRFTEDNVSLTTAFTAAQGYLEQIRTLPFAELDQTSLPTSRVPYDSSVSAAAIDWDAIDGNDALLVTPNPVPTDPSAWTWNAKKVELQQTPQWAKDDLVLYLAVHVVPDGVNLRQIYLYFFYETQARGRGGSFTSPVYSLRTIRSSAN